MKGTLKVCVDDLMDTLATAQPALFSRAGRLRRMAAQQGGIGTPSRSRPP